MTTLRVYTQPVDDHTPAGLALAIHISLDGVALNSGYPMLFAPGEIGPDNSIVPKNLTDPAIVQVSDGYVICARMLDEATAAPEGMTAWHTADFLTFRPCAPVPATAAELEIPEDMAQAAILHWNPLTSVCVQVPETVTDLAATKATITYSDGSTHEKSVAWDTSAVDFATPGRYPITGKVQQRGFRFPLAEDTGDPVLMQDGPWWYFLFTNDATNDIGLYMRRATTLDGLFEEGEYEQRLILDVDEERNFIQTFWAPEFHVIGGRLHILLAIGGKVWGPQCYLMPLKEGGDIFSPDGWETPQRVTRKDGSPLCPGGITLDMTHIHTPGGDYVAWSSRCNCMQPGDSGSMISIARIDPAAPGQLASDPVLLTRPLLGFENMAGTINNEGPYALLHDGTVYLIYSGGAANGFTYDLGQLTAPATADLTDPTVWTKQPTAVLHYRSIPGLYGPGHHSFFQVEGDTYIAYHGEPHIDGHIRCTGIHRVHFDAKGRPRFDMSRQRDLTPGLETVHTTLIIQ